MIVVATLEEASLISQEQRVEPILVTGEGAINIITALASVPRDTPIHNIGYAGSNLIPRGTRCRVGRVRCYHPEAKIQEKEFALDGDIDCYTSGDFVTATDLKVPCVFDMEIAYILALGFTNVTSEKIVSDNLQKLDYEQVLRGEKVI